MEMLRLVADAGQLWPDVLQQAPGRGVYLCMSETCLSGMNDKRLRSLKMPELKWQELRQRTLEVLEQQLRQMFTRLRVTAAIGRDAVIHRLWGRAPLSLLLAQDAGDAIVRQVREAMEKRQETGLKSLLVQAPDAAWLGEMLGRERVAVVGFDLSAMVEKMNRYCAWYGRIKVLG